MLLADMYHSAVATVQNMEQKRINKEQQAENREKMACEILAIDYQSASSGQSYDSPYC